MEPSLLIMNYQRYLFGNAQTCLISSSGCSEPFLVFITFLYFVIFLDPFLTIHSFPLPKKVTT